MTCWEGQPVQGAAVPAATADERDLTLKEELTMRIDYWTMFLTGTRAMSELAGERSASGSA